MMMMKFNNDKIFGPSKFPIHIKIPSSNKFATVVEGDPKALYYKI